jgi:hypothetical protein
MLLRSLILALALALHAYFFITACVACSIVALAWLALESTDQLLSESAKRLPFCRIKWGAISAREHSLGD